MSQESLQAHYRETAPFRVRVIGNQLLTWGPWALGVSCLVTLTWYQMRREHKRSSGQSGPSGSEPPSPPTARIARALMRTRAWRYAKGRGVPQDARRAAAPPQK